MNLEEDFEFVKAEIDDIGGYHATMMENYILVSSSADVFDHRFKVVGETTVRLKDGVMFPTTELGDYLAIDR
jgi:hypothetical protein